LQLAKSWLKFAASDLYRCRKDADKLLTRKFMIRGVDSPRSARTGRFISNKINCFKAYDVRGRIPDDLNEDIAYRIGRAYASFVSPSKVVVGHDIRLTSESISDALVKGLRDSSVDILHIGTCGTEEVYFATFHYSADGGIVVTASHNPKDYNGMKFVREDSRPISGDTGLFEIQRLAEENQFEAAGTQGDVEPLDHRSAYIEHLLTYIDASQCRPLKIVANAGNGGAGGG
jgi:phosphomannomutase